MTYLKFLGQTNTYSTLNITFLIIKITSNDENPLHLRALDLRYTRDYMSWDLYLKYFSCQALRTVILGKICHHEDIYLNNYKYYNK